MAGRRGLNFSPPPSSLVKRRDLSCLEEKTYRAREIWHHLKIYWRGHGHFEIALRFFNLACEKMTEREALFAAIPVDNRQKSVYISATKFPFFGRYFRRKSTRE